MAQKRNHSTEGSVRDKKNQMIECTVFLHCEVSGWEYHGEMMENGESSDERIISLSGEVEHRDFIERMPFDFRLVSAYHVSNIEEGPETNVLEINEPIPEYGFPVFLSALVPVAKNKLQNLKECLFLLCKNKRVTLSVTLTVNNIYKAKNGNDQIIPIEGQKMHISNFSWNLSYKGNQ